MVITSLVAGKATVRIVTAIFDCIRLHKNPLSQLDRVFPVILLVQSDRFCGRVEALGSAGQVVALHMDLNQAVGGREILKLKPDPLQTVLRQLTVVSQVEGEAVVWIADPSYKKLSCPLRCINTSSL